MDVRCDCDVYGEHAPWFHWRREDIDWWIPYCITYCLVSGASIIGKYEVLNLFLCLGSTCNMWHIEADTSCSHFYLHGLTLIPAWISNYMPSNVWGEIAYPFLNVNGCTRMDKWFQPTLHNGCNYLSMLGLKLNHVSKRHPLPPFPTWHFQIHFFNENIEIQIKISLRFLLKVPVNNIPALVQIMASHRPGDKVLFEPMMVTEGNE